MAPDPKIPPELEVDLMLAEAVGGEREVFYLALAKVFEELRAVRHELRATRVSEGGLPARHAMRRALVAATNLNRMQARRLRVHYEADAAAMLGQVFVHYYEAAQNAEAAQSESQTQLALWTTTLRDAQAAWQGSVSAPHGTSVTASALAAPGTGLQTSAEGQSESRASSGQPERVDTRSRVLHAISLFGALQLFGAGGAFGLWAFLRFLLWGATGPIHPYLGVVLVPFGFGLAATAGFALRDVIRGDH